MSTAMLLGLIAMVVAALFVGGFIAVYVLGPMVHARRKRMQNPQEGGWGEPPIPP